MKEKSSASDVGYDFLAITQSLDPIEMYGGVLHLQDLYTSSCQSLDVEFYCNLQKKRTVQRNYVDLLQKQLIILNNKNDPRSDASEIFPFLEKHIQEIQRLQSHIPSNTLIKYRDVPIDFEKQTSGNLKTHYYDLDTITNGFEKGSLIILGARSTMGKSAFCCNLLLQMSMAGTKILMINLEMTNQQIMMRLVALNSKKAIADMDKREFDAELKKTIDLPIWFMQNENKMMHSYFSFIIESIYDAIHRNHIELVVIDYLQLIYLSESTSKKFNENRNMQLEIITSKLKSLALQYEVPILCVSQLNRLVESRTDKRPIMSDLKDSGSIEQCADIVLLLYRDDYYNPEKNKGIVECIVAKNRHGNTGTVKFIFKKQGARFEEMV